MMSSWLLGAPFLEPRLFHCTIRSNGKFKVEEISNFEQDDLDPDDIMVLDGGDEVYVWIGQGSTDEEKAKSNEMAKVWRSRILLKRFTDC
jgi:gelsolin